ncbi:MAG: hypothetical protein CMK09_01370 [Ponticaulis sp.]|nr:hypothetical protein [Ponticaulis sp.]
MEKDDMKLGLFTSTLLAGAASLAMTAMPANAQTYGRGYDNYRGSGDLVLYEHGDFRGRTLPLNGDAPNLGQLRFNDATSSIEVRRGRWEVCTDGYFRGSCRILDTSVPNLSYLRMNDSISSIRRVGNHAGGYGRDRDWDRGRGWGRGDDRHDRGRGWGRNDRHGGGYGHQRGSLVVFEHGNFGGWSVPVNGDIYDLRQLRIDNQISSMQVTSGRWQVCSGTNFTGRCEVISRSLNSANVIRMNDQISSIRRVG